MTAGYMRGWKRSDEDPFEKGAIPVDLGIGEGDLTYVVLYPRTDREEGEMV